MVRCVGERQQLIEPDGWRPTGVLRGQLIWYIHGTTDEPQSSNVIYFSLDYYLCEILNFSKSF